MLDEALHRREARVGGDEDERPRRFLVEHEIAARAVHAHGCRPPPARRTPPSPNASAALARHVEMEVAVVAGAARDGEARRRRRRAGRGAPTGRRGSAGGWCAASAGARSRIASPRGATAFTRASIDCSGMSAAPCASCASITRSATAVLQHMSITPRGLLGGGERVVGVAHLLHLARDDLRLALAAAAAAAAVVDRRAPRAAPPRAACRCPRRRTRGRWAGPGRART